MCAIRFDISDDEEEEESEERSEREDHDRLTERAVVDDTDLNGEIAKTNLTLPA